MRTRSSLSLPALILLVLASAASAQGLYRHVDANGRVTYSDQPPAARDALPAGSAAAGDASPASALPYALRQTAQRYPVTLYTQEDCAPCATGRTLLQTRGIPYEERTVNTPQDIAALERLSGQNALPLLTLGSQQLKGFSDGEWSQYLDAAGYPRSAQLPASYRRPPVRPMVAAMPAGAAEAATPAPAAPDAPAPSPSADTPANPAGIRF